MEYNFEKQIDFFYGDNSSEVLSLVHPGTFEKRAGMSEELLEFISTLKKLTNKTYALANALSAGEYFGPNRNGDYFPENSLMQYHKTFEALGHVYKHHVNKDPNQSFGKVVFSHYNPSMHRVELILELDDKRAADIIEKLKAGQLPALSMGCKVPWDECSICGNRARTRQEYCGHLTKQMNQVLSDGRKVYAKNIYPKFFDISIVMIPAEKTAGFLSVLSNPDGNKTNFVEKLAFHDSSAYIKLAELSNTAEIKKQIDSKDATIVVDKDPKQLLRHAENKINDDVLCKLSEYKLNEVLSTMLALRIMPTREDFQKLALYSTDKKDLADQLEKQNIVFEVVDTDKEIEDVDYKFFNEKVAEVLMPIIPEVSLTKEFIIARGLAKYAQVWQPPQPPAERSLVSRALFSHTPDPPMTAVQNPIIPLGILGALYYGYAKVFNQNNVSKFRGFMLEHPWLLPVLIGGGALASVWSQENEFSKTAGNVDKFVRNSLISFPVSYYLAGSYQNKAQSGQPISATENLVRKHPALTALVGSIAATKAENVLRKVASVVVRLPETKINEIYTDIINLT